MTMDFTEVQDYKPLLSKALEKQFNKHGLEIHVGFSPSINLGLHDFKIKIFRGAEGLTDSVREFIQDLLPKANPEMWHYSQNAND